jgi:hypothetical protein
MQESPRSIKNPGGIALEGVYLDRSAALNQVNRFDFGFASMTRTRKASILGVWAATWGHPDLKNRYFPGPGHAPKTQVKPINFVHKSAVHTSSFPINK